MEEILNILGPFINQVGFPIVAFWLMYKMNNDTIAKVNESLAKVTQSIVELTSTNVTLTNIVNNLKDLIEKEN